MECLVDIQRYRNGEMDTLSDRGSANEILHFMEHVGFLDGCQRVLDAGCGVGHVVEWLRDRGVDAVGITYNKAEVLAGRSRADLDLQYGDIHKLPWPDGDFDGAICWDVLEHCVAPLVVLTELHRVLAPGGRLLMFVPGEDWIECEYHVLVPSIRQVIWLCKLAGFKDVGVYRYGKSHGGHDGKHNTQMAVYQIVKAAHEKTA